MRKLLVYKDCPRPGCAYALRVTYHGHGVYGTQAAGASGSWVDVAMFDSYRDAAEGVRSGIRAHTRHHPKEEK